MKRYFPHKLEFHRIEAARNSRNICGIFAELRRDNRGSKLMWRTLRYLCWEKNTVCRNAEFKLRNDNGLRVDVTSLSWSHSGKLRRLIFFKILLNILLYLWRGWLRWWWFLWWWHDDDKMMIITWSPSWRWRMFSPGHWDARDPGPWWWCGCGETRPEAVSNICIDKLRCTK